MNIALLLLLPAATLAEEVKAPVTPSPIIYELRDLRPAGFTQYVEVGELMRQYFDFQNDQGGHHVIYEEVPNAPSARFAQALRQAAIAYDSVCSMDVECSTKAFCVGECRNMYYETANAPGDLIAPDRNKCRVTSFTCEKFAPHPPPVMPAPAGATAPAPGA